LIENSKEADWIQSRIRYRQILAKDLAKILKMVQKLHSVASKVLNMDNEQLLSALDIEDFSKEELERIRLQA